MLRRLTGRWVGSGIVVSIKGGGAARTHGRGQGCLPAAAGEGGRAQEVRFNRFLGNAKVTTERLIEGWSEGTAAAVKGRHVLAIQDTSEINFATTAKRRRGLGEIGKGNGRGVLLHPMLAVDAENGTCLGLVSGAGVDAPAAVAPSRTTSATCRTRNRSAGSPPPCSQAGAGRRPPW